MAHSILGNGRRISLGTRFLFLASMFVPAVAFAKASVPAGRVENLEAIVTAIDASDAEGDADYNFILRPVPGQNLPARWRKATAFPGFENKPDFINLFWTRGDVTEWREDILACVLTGDASKFSESCKSCAGTGADGAACRMGDGPDWSDNKCVPIDRDFAAHPCPKLFQCPTCIYDMKRLARAVDAENPMTDAWYAFGEDIPNQRIATLESFTGKAEIFVGSNSCNDRECPNKTARECFSECNDLNPDIHRVMDSLGAKHSDGCVEYEWNASRRDWDYVAARDSLCGKHVLLSGVVNYDDSHDDRPEIHPVSSIIASWGDGRYTAGTFVDGSTDPCDGAMGMAFLCPWTYNYHLFGRDLMPDTVTVFLNKLIGAYPSEPQRARQQTTRRGEASFWLPSITPREGAKHNVRRVTSTEHTISVPSQNSPLSTGRSYAVEMNWDLPAGAAWTMDYTAKWTARNYSIGAGATLLTPFGILATRQPDAVPNPAPDRCDVSRVSANTAVRDLKRWYAFNVNTRVQADGDYPDWDWTKEPSSIPWPRELHHNTAFVGNKSYVFWLPVPFGPANSTTPGYEGLLKVDLKQYMGNSPIVASDTARLRTERPTVALSAGTPVVNAQAGRTPAFNYTVPLTATANRFCGSSLVYRWKKNGVAVDAMRGAGPHNLTVEPGVADLYDVTVTDEWGVEFANDARILLGPDLRARLTSTCLERVKTNPAAPKPGREGGVGTRASENAPAADVVAGQADEICTRFRLDAAADDYGGAGASFPAASRGRIRYEWSAMQYQGTPTNWEWRDIPNNWKTPSRPGENDASITIRPPDRANIRYKATVTVRDGSGRSAVANLVESTDLTSFDQTIANIFRALDRFTVAASDRATPCAGAACTQQAEWRKLAERAERLRARKSALSGRNPAALARLRATADRLIDVVRPKFARALGVAYKAPARATFTVKPKRFRSSSKLQTAARRQALENLLNDPQFPNRWRR